MCRFSKETMQKMFRLIRKRGIYGNNMLPKTELSWEIKKIISGKWAIKDHADRVLKFMWIYVQMLKEMKFLVELS